MPTDPTDAFRLDGKVALVTGGSRGLGKEMVMAFARVGADVVISSRKQDACESLAKEVERETGRRALAVGAHVADWNAMDDLAAKALDNFGHVDVLVNNAGMSLLYDDIRSVDESHYDKVMDVEVAEEKRPRRGLGGRYVFGVRTRGSGRTREEGQRDRCEERGGASAVHVLRQFP